MNYKDLEEKPKKQAQTNQQKSGTNTAGNDSSVQQSNAGDDKPGKPQEKPRRNR